MSDPAKPTIEQIKQEPKAPEIVKPPEVKLSDVKAPVLPREPRANDTTSPIPHVEFVAKYKQSGVAKNKAEFDALLKAAQDKYGKDKVSHVYQPQSGQFFIQQD